MTTINHDGQPGCKTAEEWNQVYRNNWDPTAYWKCGAEGESAKKFRCPSSKLYLDSAKKCVNVWEWVWTEPVEPPSRPPVEELEQ